MTSLRSRFSLELFNSTGTESETVFFLVIFPGRAGGIAWPDPGVWLIVSSSGRQLIRLLVGSFSVRRLDSSRNGCAPLQVQSAPVCFCFEYSRANCSRESSASSSFTSSASAAAAGAAAAAAER